MSESGADITAMLRALGTGDSQDATRLMEVIYEDLKRLAASQLRGERGNHTLQPTALVHEAYLRLVDQRTTDWRDRFHFFSIAARVIRRILVDHARQRNAQKRGGAMRSITLDGQDVAAPEASLDLLALDEALLDLAEISPRQAQIVELRYFGGLTIPDVATALNLGNRSVDREWQVARAWLLHRLTPGGMDS